MANESVVQEAIEVALKGSRVTQPDYIYSEKDPFERIVTRLEGLKRISDLAFFMGESGATADHARDLWYSVGLTAEDIKRDLYQLNQEGHTHG